MRLMDLFQAIESKMPILVQLFDENDLLVIKFELPGFDALDDYLLEKTVNKLEIISSNSLKIKLN